MFDEFNDGFCPQCLLKDRQVGMILNFDDFWECPECHLQAHTAEWGFLTILRTRGHGKLTTTMATDFVSGVNLAKAKDGNQWREFDETINTEDELTAFINEEIK